MAGAKKPVPKPRQGQTRVAIEHVTPEIDGGRFPAKRVVGEAVVVEADVFGDGHDHVEARLLLRTPGDKSWNTVPLRPLGNDRWQASFPVSTRMSLWNSRPGLCC